MTGFVKTHTEDDLEVFTRTDGGSILYFVKGREKQVEAYVCNVMNEYPTAGYGTTFETPQEQSREPGVFTCRGWRGASCD